VAGIAAFETRFASPANYTPTHIAEKVLSSRSALEGERKQVTVLFADLKGSMELLANRDPEEARRLLDPALTCMTEAVHRYDGTVNQVMGPTTRRSGSTHSRRRALRALLRTLLGEDAGFPPLVRLLIERTEGNPFFLEEAVRSLLEMGAISGTRGAYRLVKPVAGLDVPATVQAVLAARIDRLPPDEKYLLQSAAVRAPSAGRRWPPATPEVRPFRCTRPVSSPTPTTRSSMR
jgi:hypothetical protein